jgi:hypothetical protein
MQTVKLSVTVKRQLERKYNAVALKQINTAIKNSPVHGSRLQVKPSKRTVRQPSTGLEIWCV